jgi:RND family efflux transporter MFP subunit
VEEGAPVTKGEILAQFNDDEQRSQLRQAELEVSRLEVEAEQYTAMVKLNRSELDRESLLASQGLSSRADVERAQYKLDQSVQEYQKTRLAIESAKARVAEVKLELQKSKVVAPLAGVVIRRYISPGSTVAKNDKLFEVGQVSRMELRFRVPQSAGARLGPGQTLDLSTIDPNTIVAKARVRRVDPIADATSNTFGYVAEIIGAQHVIPGMTVYVHLTPPTRGVSFWVPRAAFKTGANLQEGASSLLFVVKAERASCRNVVVKALEGDQVEVVGDLVKQDSVVLAPPPELKDGDRVEVTRD